MRQKVFLKQNIAGEPNLKGKVQRVKSDLNSPLNSTLNSWLMRMRGQPQSREKGQRVTVTFELNSTRDSLN